MNRLVTKRQIKLKENIFPKINDKKSEQYNFFISKSCAVHTWCG